MFFRICSTDNFFTSKSSEWSHRIPCPLARSVVNWKENSSSCANMVWHGWKYPTSSVWLLLCCKFIRITGSQLGIEGGGGPLSSISSLNGCTELWLLESRWSAIMTSKKNLLATPLGTEKIHSHHHTWKKTDQEQGRRTEHTYIHTDRHTYWYIHTYTWSHWIIIIIICFLYWDVIGCIHACMGWDGLVW